MSSHAFNTKSSYWSYKNNKHFYSSKGTSKKKPAILATNILPHTLNEQMNLQRDKLNSNSFKTFPSSKNYEKTPLKNFIKQNNISQKVGNTTIPKNFDCLTNKHQESIQAKKDSKKLIREIMAITHQLKLKSKSLGSSCEQRLKGERCSSFSKIKSIKVPTKKTPENKGSVSHYSSCTSKKDLILHNFSNNFQIQAACNTNYFKKIKVANTTDCFKKTQAANTLDCFKKTQAANTLDCFKKTQAANTTDCFKKIQTVSITDCFKKTPTPNTIYCFKKTLDSRNSGNSTAFANVQVKLDRIEKMLENSSNRTTKNLSNRFTQINAMSAVISNHTREAHFKKSEKLMPKTPLKPKIESKKINKHNSKFGVKTDKTYLKNYKFLYNRSPFSKKANQLPKTSNKLKSKYKIVNESQVTEKAPKEENASTNCVKKSSGLRKKHSSSYKLINIDAKKTTSNLKMSHNHLSLKNSRNCVASPYSNLRRKKHKFNYFAKKQNVVRSHLPEHVSYNKLADIYNASGIDSDLLIELAAENKINLKQIPNRRLYKSKNRIINSHSIQERTAKMIKLKYFNPSKKCTVWRNLATQTSKGFFRGATVQLSRQNKSFTRINKRSIRSNKIVSNKFQTPKVRLQNKKIVTLKGEKFIIGSEGKSLQKLKQSPKCRKKTQRSPSYKSPFEVRFPEKTPSPASKIVANRVLNLSINRMLSASEKKKLNKVNIYCMFYNRFGRCNKGVKCPYVHDPSKIAVCTRFLRGTCKNNKCPFSHEINPGKMAICSFFLQDICTNKQCPYRHEKVSPDAKLCKDFVQGYCIKGKECKKAHVLICPKYVQGICEKGKDCVFPHPVARDKKIISKESKSIEKTDDHLLETVSRYFQSNHDKDDVRGLVVPRRKTLPEQPSFISLTLEE